jgi:hypothetical protein
VRPHTSHRRAYVPLWRGLQHPSGDVLRAFGARRSGADRQFWRASRGCRCDLFSRDVSRWRGLTWARCSYADVNDLALPTRLHDQRDARWRGDPIAACVCKPSPAGVAPRDRDLLAGLPGAAPSDRQAILPGLGHGQSEGGLCLEDESLLRPPASCGRSRIDELHGAKGSASRQQHFAENLCVARDRWSATRNYLSTRQWRGRSASARRGGRCRCNHRNNQSGEQHDLRTSSTLRQPIRLHTRTECPFWSGPAHPGGAQITCPRTASAAPVAGVPCTERDARIRTDMCAAG